MRPDGSQRMRFQESSTPPERAQPHRSRFDEEAADITAAVSFGSGADVGTLVARIGAPGIPAIQNEFVSRSLTTLVSKSRNT
jgi:hypothetical protein